MAKNILFSLVNLTNSQKLVFLILIDTLLIILSLFLSFSLRLGKIFIPYEIKLYVVFFISPLIGLPIFYKFGLYNNITRFYNINFIVNLISASFLYAFLWSALIIIFNVQEFPRSVLLINGLLIINLIILSRLTAKLILDNEKFKYSFKSSNITNSIVFGADKNGNLLAENIRQSKENEKVIAFVEDDRKYIDRQINYIKIYHFSEIDNIIEKYNVKKVYLTKNLSDEIIDKILKIKSQTNIEILTYDYLNTNSLKKTVPKKIKKIQISDILNRDKVLPQPDLLNKNILNKVVLVTGAGGSIGHELSKQIINLKPKKLILYEMHEYSLFKSFNNIQSINENQKIDVLPILGDLSNNIEILKCLNENKVETLFHAAAYKHVKLVEENITQSFINNVISTYNLVKCLRDSSVKNFVLISTDKAVRPSSIMGATKRICEKIIINTSLITDIKREINFSIVRFGNVLNSSGSAIPIFQKQIDNGGPITVTDERATRYFMSIEEASELVIQSSGLDKKFGIYLLEMGKPVKIIDIAKKMILLNGKKIFTSESKKNENSIKIIFTGLQKGEKIFEELFIENTTLDTKHPKIKLSKEINEFNRELNEQIEILIFDQNISDKKIINFLNKFVENFINEK